MSSSSETGSGSPGGGAPVSPPKKAPPKKMPASLKAFSISNPNNGNNTNNNPPAQLSANVNINNTISSSAPMTMQQQSRSSTGSSSNTPSVSNPPSPAASTSSQAGKKPQFKMSLPPRKLENLQAVSLTPVTTPGAQFSSSINTGNVFATANSQPTLISIGSGSFNPPRNNNQNNVGGGEQSNVVGGEASFGGAGSFNPNNNNNNSDGVVSLGQINTSNSTTSGTFSDAPSPGGAPNSFNQQSGGMSNFTSSSTTDTSGGSGAVASGLRDGSSNGNFFANSLNPGGNQQQWFPNIHSTSSKASPLMDSYSAGGGSAFANVNSSSTNYSTASSSNGGFHANEVYPNLYIGSVVDASNATLLRSLGIVRILNVALECDFSESVKNAKEHITTKKVPLRDNADEDIKRVFAETFEFIDAGIQQGGKVLVHCFVGSSRSPTVVIAYIMRKLWQQQSLIRSATSSHRGSMLMMPNNNNNNNIQSRQSSDPNHQHNQQQTTQQFFGGGDWKDSEKTQSFIDLASKNHRQNTSVFEGIREEKGDFDPDDNNSSTTDPNHSSSSKKEGNNNSSSGALKGQQKQLHSSFFNDANNASILSDDSCISTNSLSGTLKLSEAALRSLTTKNLSLKTKGLLSGNNNNNNDDENDGSNSENGINSESFYHQALAIVQLKRGECYPNIGFVQALMDYEKALKSFTPPVLTPRMSPQRTMTPRRQQQQQATTTTTGNSSNAGSNTGLGARTVTLVGGDDHSNCNNHDDGSSDGQQKHKRPSFVEEESWSSPDSLPSMGSKVHTSTSVGNSSMTGMTRNSTAAPSSSQ